MKMNRLFVVVLCFTVAYNEAYAEILPDVIETTSGFVRGNVLKTPLNGKEFHAYRGIPYAEAPIGQQRFRAPEPYQPREGKTIDAIEYGPACYQSSGSSGSNSLNESEDCLSINVFVPKHVQGKKLSVIAFIYGGAFSKGHSTDIAYGPDFLVEKGVIFVSFNYRVGPLGFMSLGIKGFTGNMGLKDQQLALKWIHNNIENFGGNKDEVTLLGHSAGSASAHYHLLNCKSRDYFKRIILLSSVVTNYYARSLMADHKNIMYEFAENHSGTHIDSDDQLINILQAVDAQEVTLFKKFDERMIVMETIWSPVYDGSYNIPGNANDSFVKNSPEKLYDEYKRKGVEKAALFTYTSMEAIIVQIFNDPTSLQRLNEEFSIPLPFHGFTKNKYEQKYAEILHKIKRFYFGDGEIDKDSTFKVFNLLSDLNFAYGINKAVKMHANHSISPTYYLRFSMSSVLNRNKMKLNAYKSDAPGCSHAEERYYIFKSRSLENMYQQLLIEKKNFKDFGITLDTLEYVTELLTTFAKTGVPKIESAHLLDFPMVKNDAVAFVDITNDGPMTGFNPNARAFQFWREIEKEVEGAMK